MSKPFDYSKWDKLELSDDEDDVHPNIDKESWFRMKHRSRVEREEREEADKKKIRAEMDKANQRLKVLAHDLAKLKAENDDDSDEDDDLGEGEGIKAEMAELEKENASRQAKLDEYERNKKWNVDNICHVAEERTVVNPDFVKPKHTADGFALPKEPLVPEKLDTVKKESVEAKPAPVEPAKKSEPKAKPSAEKSSSSKAAPKPAPAVKAAVAGPIGPAEPATRGGSDAMETYHEFTEKYAEVVEEFMALTSLEKSKEFLLLQGDVLLQENASNYLLLASLEDEMNGYRDKMRQTARQSQIISNIAELAKSLDSHPGNVIVPFFARLNQKEHLATFMAGVEDFVQKIIARAVTKKIEIDRQRAGEADDGKEGVDLADIPREERLGPGGLDPLEVIETLPVEMQKAFESRDVEMLKEVLMKMDPGEAEACMKRCIDSGLWNAQA